jgi:phage terminase small subunit
MSKLTPKRIRFAEEYIIDFNATAAYTRAGYSASTVAVARSEGFKLLQIPEIQAYILSLCNQRSEKTGITVERVLEELERLATSNLLNIGTWDNAGGLVLKSSEEIEPKHSAAISSITCNTKFDKEGNKTVTLSCKLHDKTRPLELIAKYLGMINDFNGAIACLRKYGLDLYQDNKGEWNVRRINVSPNT